ncbi:GGDEF domain-containing protein [Blastococcus sp. SYSU D00669]
MQRPTPATPVPGHAVAMPLSALDGLALATLEATAALVLVCDADGRILLANPALQRFSGRSRYQLTGASLYDVVVQPAEREIARVGIAAVFAGEPAIPGEVDWVNGDGEARRIELQTSVLTHSDGRPYAMAFIGIDVTVHREREAQARKLAMTDPLTGVANRSALFAALRAHLDPATGASCGLLFCDLDGFKAVNDVHGHALGDRVLVAVAERLRQLAGPEDIVARLGGDEFVVVVPGIDGAALEARMTELEALMEQPFELDDVVVRLGASIGSASGQPGDDADGIMAEADLAMYGVKSVRRAQRS